MEAIFEEWQPLDVLSMQDPTVELCQIAKPPRSSDQRVQGQTSQVML